MTKQIKIIWSYINCVYVLALGLYIFYFQSFNFEIIVGLIVLGFCILIIPFSYEHDMSLDFPHHERIVISFYSFLWCYIGPLSWFGIIDALLLYIMAILTTILIVYKALKVKKMGVAK